MGGVHTACHRQGKRRHVAGRGRPERESRTPVNMGNEPHRDNGEGVAATPLPYPLLTSRTY